MATSKERTKTSEKKVSKSDSNQELDNTNKKVTTQKVIIHRNLKYIYPRGCNDTVLRKAYRQKVRGHIERLEAEISKLRGEDRKTKKEELAEYKIKHLS